MCYLHLPFSSLKMWSFRPSSSRKSPGYVIQSNLLRKKQGGDGLLRFYQNTLYLRDKGLCLYLIQSLRHLSHSLRGFPVFRDGVSSCGACGRCIFEKRGNEYLLWELHLVSVAVVVKYESAVCATTLLFTRLLYWPSGSTATLVLYYHASHCVF